VRFTVKDTLCGGRAGLEQEAKTKAAWEQWQVKHKEEEEAEEAARKEAYELSLKEESVRAAKMNADAQYRQAQAIRNAPPPVTNVIFPRVR
jgi:hypothetical protein